MFNVACYLDASARRCPNDTAVVFNDRRYTYANLHAMANRVANGLASAGFGPGDRISLCCPNRPGFLAAYYGILKIGATAVLHTTSLTRRDILAEIRESGSRALFTFDGYGNVEFAEMAIEAAMQVASCEKVWAIPHDPSATSPVAESPALADLMRDQSTSFRTVARGYSDTAVVLFTSGTNGRSKGVEITHGNIASMSIINLPLVAPGAARVRLVVTPLYHIMGQIFCLNLTVLTAETMVLVDRFDPDLVWHMIAREGATQIVMLPIFYRWLLDHADSVDARRIRETLRLCGTGGGPLPETWSREFEARFGLPIVPGYGMTEATGIVSWHCPSDRLRLRSVGRPVAGVEVRIASPEASSPCGIEGEILVHSPGVMKGYVGLPEVTGRVVRDGWLRTGDVGMFDEDGYLYVRGHLGGMIIRGKEHVYPAEIENVLHDHPLVARAAAVAVPHELLGQDVRTYVELKPGFSMTEPELLSWMRREIPEGKCPDEIEIVPALPLTETGKVARHLLAIRRHDQAHGHRSGLRGT